MFPSRSESLAQAFHQPVVQGGIESVTMRALARELRTAPGTITNDPIGSALARRALISN